jgi:hypothetical protein
MKPIDVINTTGINRMPDKTVMLTSNGTFVERGYVVRSVNLNLYILRKDKALGPYSILAAYVETDKGAIEVIYDEGYRGEHALEEAVAFLTSRPGISSLILSCIIQLENPVR